MQDHISNKLRPHEHTVGSYTALLQALTRQSHCIASYPLSSPLLPSSAPLPPSASPTQGNCEVQFNIRRAGVSVDLIDKQNVVEGLARATALLPAPEASKAGQRLIRPFLEAAQAEMQTNSGDNLNCDKRMLNALVLQCILFMPSVSYYSAFFKCTLSQYRSSTPGYLLCPCLVCVGCHTVKRMSNSRMQCGFW